MFASFVFSTKSYHFYCFRFSHMYLYVEELFHEKKVSLLLVYFHLRKKLGRPSYDVIVTDHDVILILFLFRFVANVQDLQRDNFLVLTMNRRRVIRIYLPRAKMTPSPQVYTGLK